MPDTRAPFLQEIERDYGPTVATACDRYLPTNPDAGQMLTALHCAVQEVHHETLETFSRLQKVDYDDHCL